MNITRRHGLKLMGATALASLPMTSFAGSHATVHEIQMLNKAPDSNERQVFNPPVLKINAGDTVKFVATDRGHNSEANADMLPEGVEAWKGKIGEEFEVTLDTPGVYGYHCTPHQSAGMVGLILVGDVTVDDLAPMKEVRQRGKAKARYDEYFAMAEAMIAQG